MCEGWVFATIPCPFPTSMKSQFTANFCCEHAFFVITFQHCFNRLYYSRLALLWLVFSLLKRNVSKQSNRSGSTVLVWCQWGCRMFFVVVVVVFLKKDHSWNIYVTQTVQLCAHIWSCVTNLKQMWLLSVDVSLRLCFWCCEVYMLVNCHQIYCQRINCHPQLSLCFWSFVRYFVVLFEQRKCCVF